MPNNWVISIYIYIYMKHIIIYVCVRSISSNMIIISSNTGSKVLDSLLRAKRAEEKLHRAAQRAEELYNQMADDLMQATEQVEREVRECVLLLLAFCRGACVLGDRVDYPATLVFGVAAFCWPPLACRDPTLLSCSLLFVCSLRQGLFSFQEGIRRFFPTCHNGRFIKGSWEATLPCYGQIEFWDSTSNNNTLNEGCCATLHHITIHSIMKGGVRLYITYQYNTSRNNTLHEGWCETIHHITIHHITIHSMNGGLRPYITS